MSLSRGVAGELPRGSPWRRLPPAGGDAWIGNLEGAVGAGECDAQICLGVDPEDLRWLAERPFAAMSLENNHGLDYGAAGRAETIRALGALQIAALTAEDAPHALEIAGQTWAIVPLDLSESGVQETLERARLQVALARARTPRVVAFLHWGWEGVPEATPLQQRAAALMRAWGAALVVGAHAHVPQPVDCDAGAIYGLGNFLFDQGPHREGLAARCCAGDRALECAVSAVSREDRSVAPTIGAEVARCEIPLGPEPDTRWLAHPGADDFLSIQPLAGAGEGAFLGLHRRWSGLDREAGIRPYVFQIGPGGAIRELWRGSALSWPLVAARLIQSGDRELLCAIHRGDSFLAPDPSTTERRRAVYAWRGLTNDASGFAQVDDPAALAACELL